MKLPNNRKILPKDGNRVVLAYGEVTGHAHAFMGEDTVELSTDIQETKKFIEIKKQDDLTHEEHTKHTFFPGEGEVIQQSEYTMGEIRRVAD